MEQVVLKPQNLLEQLHILANDLHVQDHLSISDLFDQTYQLEPLPHRILKAIWGNDSLKEITMAECTEQDGQVCYQGKRYVSESDQLRLRLI
jgi:hypothetical protein